MCLLYVCLQSSLTQPQMMVVPDLDDLFLPLPDDLLVNLSDSRHVVDSFLDCLPSMFQENPNVESATGPALKAAYMVMVCIIFLQFFTTLIRCTINRVCMLHYSMLSEDMVIYILHYGLHYGLISPF